jgi:hypothetical protein
MFLNHRGYDPQGAGKEIKPQIRQIIVTYPRWETTIMEEMTVGVGPTGGYLYQIK